MSDEVRSVLKIFGISVTNFENVVNILEKGNINPSEAVKKYTESCIELNNNMAELLNLIAKLHDKAIKALKNLT